jgi:hypothetical protein
MYDCDEGNLEIIYQYRVLSEKVNFVNYVTNWQMIDQCRPLGFRDSSLFKKRGAP